MTLKRGVKTGSLQNRSVYFAALLHNNEAVFPFWQRELVKALLAFMNDDRSNVNVCVRTHLDFLSSSLVVEGIPPTKGIMVEK